MKHGICIVLVSLFTTVNAYTQSTSIPLQKWEFRKSGDQNWMRATVPGCVHTDLLAHNAIADPFYGNNESAVQWVEKENWEYRTTVHVHHHFLKNDFIDIQFEGLDTYADVYINDSLLFSANNMFRQWTYDIKDYLHPGDNTIYILFHSPVKKADEAASEHFVKLPPDNRVFVRKAQYQFGWDWGPRLVTSGIWKPARIVGYRDLRVKQSQFRYDERGSDTVAVEIQLLFQATQKMHYDVLVQERTTGRIVYKKSYKDKLPTMEYIAFDFIIPERWKPAGMGAQALYHFDITIKHRKHLYFEKTYTTGFSNIKLHQEKDATGSGFYFTVNGDKLFVKGANLIPLHSFPSAATRAHYYNVLTEAKAMHINMIRIWGGGLYEDDYLYDLCDSLGIMVWQDFMFACAMYPHNLTAVNTEFTQQIARIKDHACIALWCGNNEIDEGWANWGWQKQFGYSDTDSASIKHINDQLFRQFIPAALYTEGNAAQSYHPSSPTHGWGRKESLLEGDAHYWGVWWGKQPFSVFNQKVPRFMSEYGFQGMPAYRSFRQFIPADELYAGSPSVKAHQKHPTGYETIHEYMQRDYTVPDTFEDYIYVSQLLQADGMRIAIEAHRRNMPYCMGTMFWQLNDCWPVTSWSVTDFYGNRKASFYTVQDAYRDAMISVVEQDDQIETWLINDQHRARKVTLAYAVIQTDGKTIRSDSLVLTLEPFASTLLSVIDIPYLLQGTPKGAAVLHITLRENDVLIAERTHLFVKPAELQLEQPEFRITLNEARNTITISSDTYVRQAYLYTDAYELKLSDNFFDLLPNSPKEISLQEIPDGGAPELEQIRIKCLNTIYNQ